MDATVENFVNHLRTCSVPPRTIETYGDLLRRVDRDLLLGLARSTTEEIATAAFITSRGPSSRALYRAAIRAFFRWACDPVNPLLDFNPAEFLPRQKVPKRRPRPTTSDALTDILARAEAPYRQWFLLAAYAGMRCCEVSAADRRHMDRERIWIRGKGGRERVVPTHPLIWQWVETLPPGRLVAQKGQDVDRRYVSRYGNRYLDRLGHPDITMHRLRHWFATYVHRAAGGDIRITQELIGHGSPATTAAYVAVAEDMMTNAVRGLPDLTRSASAAA
jgi:integrase/recombinase XerC